MEYLLMSKNNKICKIKIDSLGQIENILEIYNETYKPVGVSLNVRNSLNEWWNGRSIPASRHGLSSVLANLDIHSSNILSVKGFGLSLTDQYWIKPIGLDVCWEDVNFFDNEFSKDIGNAFFDKDFSKPDIDFLSPDNTSDGWLKKKWLIIDDGRYLVKTGSNPFCQEPYNEVIASLILKKLDTAPFVEYGIYEDELQGACSICKNFISKDTELVSAFNLNKLLPRDSNESSFNHFIKVCNHLDIPNINQSLDTMFVLDYIIANRDRHGGNFGVIRDVNSLKFIGPAPIYDSGTSLWNNQFTKIGIPVSAQPFISNHEEQVRLVKDWSIFDFSKLVNIHKDCYEILSANKTSSVKRNREICQALKERVLSISLLQKQYTNTNIANLDDVVISKYKKFKFNHQHVLSHYLRQFGVQNTSKYNPALDGKVFAKLLQDGFSLEHCKKIMLNSPNIKSDKMLEILCKKLSQTASLKKYFDESLTLG